MNTTNYIPDRAIPEFSFYTNVHKLVRKEIFETCILVGNTDLYDKESLDTFKNKFNALLELLRNHASHEETFIHPLLNNMPAEFNLLSNEHEESEALLSGLENLFIQVIDAANKTACLKYSNQFYLELCQFASVYLNHLNFEETTIMTALRAHYDLSALNEVMDNFKKSQPVEEAMQSLNLLFAAISPAESQFFLTSVQESVPNEIFLEICKIAMSAMPANNWQKMDAHTSIRM